MVALRRLLKRSDDLRRLEGRMVALRRLLKRSDDLRRLE
jgi:hypothetical protein